MKSHLSLSIRISLHLLAILTLALLYLFIYEPRYHGALTKDEQVLVFAHRGFGNHAPDNSLEGAELALGAGLDGVDVDAQSAKDGDVVIFHDVSLERFTTGTGRVDANTLTELQTYDLSEKFGNGFDDVYIRTFEDFVKTITPTSRLMVELKVASARDTGIERHVADIIAKYDVHDRVYISSFNPVVLYRLKRIDPEIRTVFIFMDSGWDPKRVAETKEEDRVSLPWYLQTEWTRRAIRKIIAPDALSINHTVNESTIVRLIERGYPVFLWPVNDTESIERALTYRPYGIVSDEPLLAKELRDAMLTR